MTESNELARHLINRNAALRMSEDLKMPEILEAYDRHMEAQRIDQAQTAFAKDIARQCVAIDIRQKSLAKGIYHRGTVYTARQLRDAGIEVGKDVPDHTKFTLSTSRAVEP